MCEGQDNFTTDTGNCMTISEVSHKGNQPRNLPDQNLDWKAALDNRKVVGLVYLDFQKAFNPVSQKNTNLLASTMGFSRDLLQCIVSHLKDRKQFTEVNGYS